MEGATVRIGEHLYRSDTSGEVRLNEPEAGTAIEVATEGYRTVSGSVDDASANQQVVSLRPSIV